MWKGEYMTAAYLLLPALIWVPFGIYLYHIIVRFLSLFHIREKTAVSRILSLAVTLFCVSRGWMLYGLGAVVLFHFLAFSAGMEIVWQIGRRKIQKEKTKRRLQFVCKSSIVSLLLLAIVFAYGFYNIKDVRRTHYSVEAGEKAADGFRIVQISDLHMGTTMGTEELKTYCRQIEKEKPDLLALTGDIFDESTARSEMQEAARLLGGIQTTYGTYYIFGNHDYNLYTQTPYYTRDELKDTMEKEGIRVLEDEVTKAADWLTVIGRTDASLDRAEISSLMDQADSDSFFLLLDHQPEDLDENKAAGVNLQLSGHTHAGQIWPTGQLGSLFGVTELNYGYREDGAYHVIVSSGIGGWGYAIRTGGHSEYVVIDVNSET